METRVKLGPKGQIMIRKEFRDVLEIEPGMYVQMTLKNKCVFIKPIPVHEELEKVRKIRMMLKPWPKGMDSVKAVREQRE